MNSHVRNDIPLVQADGSTITGLPTVLVSELEADAAGEDIIWVIIEMTDDFLGWINEPGGGEFMCSLLSDDFAGARTVKGVLFRGTEEAARKFAKGMTKEQRQCCAIKCVAASWRAKCERQ